MTNLYEVKYLGDDNRLFTSLRCGTSEHDRSLWLPDAIIVHVRYIGEYCGEQAGAIGDGRGHAQQAAWGPGQVTHFGKTLGDVVKLRPRVVHQALASFGELHAARGAAHQLHASGFFQLRQVVADVGT